MPEKNDSLIASLQGLLWSAIIGVASFQIIAPNVWGYIHDALALPYKTAYWIFTLCYFLSLPVYLLVWLLLNRISFANHGKILWFLFVFICLQSLGMLITLRWYFPEWFFIVLFVVYAVCCGLLLAFYVKAAWRRIVEDHIRRYFNQLVLFTVLAFVLLFSVEYVYIMQWHKDKSQSHYMGTDQSSYYAGNRGFALIDLKDTIDSRISAVCDWRDSIRFAHLGDSVGAGDAARAADSVADGAFVSYYAGLIDLRKSIGQLSSHLANPSREVLTDSIESLAGAVPVLGLSGGGGAAGGGAGSGGAAGSGAVGGGVAGNGAAGVGAGGIGAVGGGAGSGGVGAVGPLQHYRADLRYVESIRHVLQGLSAKVAAESQAQLGLQLRSVQIKGIIILVTLFFTMLSLYIYLSIDQRLQDMALDFLNDRKRMGEAVPEKVIIDQEKTVADATSVVGSLWICLTVIVWLLVPLFKPVKDADIDTQQIYKIHTLANWGQGGTQVAAAGSSASVVAAGSAGSSASVVAAGSGVGAEGSSASVGAGERAGADSTAIAVPGGK